MSVAQCRKFQANIFNKSKCQHCFKPKELHSAEALEGSKVARKISKCGYLFVAPDSFDFSNPLHSSRRWQRRFIVLYDDGELTYSVDENVHTIPQGVIDMNVCTDVYDGENATSHQNSIAVATPKSTTYMKANAKDDISRWHDVLIMYPRSRKTKHRRSPTYPTVKPEPATTKTQAPTHSDTPPTSPPPPPPPTTTTTTTTTTTEINNKNQANINNNINNSSSSNNSDSSSVMKRPRYNSSYHPSPGRGRDRGQEKDDKDSQQRAPLNGDARKSEMEVEYSSRKEERGESVDKKSREPGRGSTSSNTSNGLTDQGVQQQQQQQQQQLTYRGVRSLKHKHDKHYTEALRKSNSLNDLSTDVNVDDEATVEDLRLRSRSRDSASRHRPVSAKTASYSRYLFDEEEQDDEETDTKPKTLFESLLMPEPPKSKNDRYLRLANIPVTRSIERYVGHVSERSRSQSPRRNKRKPAASDIGPGVANRVANTARFYESKSESCTGAAATTDSRNPRRLHGSSQAVVSTSMMSSARAESRRSRRDLSGNVTPSMSPSLHSALLDTKPPVSPRTMMSTTLGSIGQDARQAAAARSRSSSPPLRTSPSSSGRAVYGRSPSQAAAQQQQQQHQQQRSEREERIRRSRSPTSSLLLNGKSKNETDEWKMAKSSINGHMVPAGDKAPRVSTVDDHDDLMYMKKGWLVKQGVIDKDWSKHWFVLSGSTLKYYHDSQAEEVNALDGVIDLSHCHDVSEVHASRNYGFRIKTRSDTYTLSAMTSGIRNNWLLAIKKCVDSIGNQSNSSSSPYSPSRRASDTRNTQAGASPENSYPWRSSPVTSTSDHSASSSKYSWTPEKTRIPRYVTEKRSASESRGPRGRRRTLDDISCRDSPSPPPSSSPRLSPRGSPRPSPRSRLQRYNTTLAGDADSEQVARFASYLDESEQSPNRRALSPQEVQELDNVERNIRRIHRKSITEYIHHQKPPQHFEKFESGSAFREKGAVGGDRARSSPADQRAARQYRNNFERELAELEALASHSTATATTPPTNRRKSDVEHHKPQHRAPSAKVKERSKAKATRPRSPPPEISHDDLGQEGLDYGDPADTSDIIERKWREVEKSGLVRRGEHNSASEDGPLVELLEAEVESLKARLDQKNRDMEELQQTNFDLKSQLRLNRNDHRDSLNDMETDQGRFLSQISDIQDQMEQTTECLQARLADEVKKSKLAKQQIANLKADLENADRTMQLQEQEVKTLQSKLELTSADLSYSETALNTAEEQATKEQEALAKKAREWEKKLTKLRDDLKQKDDLLLVKDKSISEKSEKARCLQTELDKKNDRLEALEAELQESSALHQEKAEEVDHLQQEVDLLRQQLRSQDEAMQRIQREGAAKIKTIEDEFYSEKERLDNQIQQLKKKYEQALKQHTMSDSLTSNMTDILKEKDETIAQLEEKVIEHDNKIVELSEELNAEIEDNSKLRTSLEETCGENSKLRRDVEEARKEGESLQEELEQVNEETDQVLSRKMENELLKNDIDKMEEELKMLAKENKELKDKLKLAGDNLVQERQDQHYKLQQKSDEITKLKLAAPKMSSSELSMKYDTIKSQVLRSEGQIAQLKSELEQEQAKVKALQEMKQAHEKLKLENEELKKKASEKIEVVQKVEVQKTQAPAPASSSAPIVGAMATDYNGLKQQYLTLTRKISDVQKQLQDVQQKCQTLDTENTQLKQDLRKAEVDKEQKVIEASAKVSDLENKLAVAERRLRRHERRRSSKIDEDEDSADLNTSASSGASGASGASETSAELVTKVKGLEVKLEASEVKVTEVTKRLLDQKSLEVEIGLLKQENKKLAKEITQDMDRSQEEGKDDFDPSGHLQEVECKLGQTEALLEECRFKVSDVITELNSRNVSKIGGDPYIQKLPIHLQDILTTTSDGEDEHTFTSISSEHKMRLCAEKLALEAAILNKMASSLKDSKPKDLLSERKQYILQIQNLDQKIESQQHLLSMKTSSNGQVDSGLEGISVAEYASLLTDKMVLQSKIATLVEGLEPVEAKPTESSPSYDKLAAVVLQRCVMDQQLLSSHLPGNSTSPVSSSALLQADLAFMYSKLKTKITDTDTSDPIESAMYKDLLNRRESFAQCVNAHTSLQIKEICKIMVQQSSLDLSKEKSELAEAHHSICKEILQSEVDKVVEQYLVLYSAQMSSVGESVSSAVKQQSGQLVEDIMVEYESMWKAQSSSSSETVADFQKLDTSRMCLLVDLLHTVIQKCVICAEVETIKPKVSKVEHTPLHRYDSGHSSQPTSPLAKKRDEVSEIADCVRKDAAVKSQLATYLLNNTSSSGAQPDMEGQVAKLAAQLMDVDLCLQVPPNADYLSVVTHEALHQAQLAYTVHWARRDLQQQITNLQKALATSSQLQEEHVGQLQEEVEKLTCVISEKEMELARESADSNVSVSQMEEQLQCKEIEYHAELQHLQATYELKIKHLQHELELSLAGTSSVEGELENKNSYFEQEVQALKDGYEIRIRSLQSDLEDAKKQVDKSNAEKDEEFARCEEKTLAMETEMKALKSELEYVQKEKYQQGSDYEQQVIELEDKVDRLKDQHKRALQDAEDRVTSAEATPVGEEGEENAKLSEDVRRLQRELQKERTRREAELEKLRAGLSGDGDGTAQALLSDKIQQLQHQIQNMQADYEQEIACQKAGHRRELARSKDDLLQLLASVEAQSIQIDEEVIRKRYTKELDRIREMSDRGYNAMEKSHQRVIMEMRRAHKKELDLLRQEKDELLEEETKATQSALDAMRKAHEGAVQKERGKFLDMMAKTYSHSDVESLQRQHEDDLDLIQHEMRELTEQYSIKCLENASLEERLDVQTRALHHSRKRIQDLLARNEELSTKLKHEIDKLNRMITHNGTSFLEDEHDSPEVSELKVVLKVKQAEVGQLNDEINGLKEKLLGTIEELEDSMDQYHELYSDNQSTKQRYEAEINQLRRRIDEQSVIGEEDGEWSPLSTPRGLRPSEDGSDSLVTSTPRSIRTSEYLSSESEQGTPPSLRRSALRATSPDGRAGGTEIKTHKRTSWRLRQPQRARSSPGLSITNLATLPRQQSVEQPPTASAAKPPVIDTSGARSSRADRHKTTVGFNVSDQRF